MKTFILSVIFAFFRFTLQNPQSFWTLYPNILVLEVNGSLGHHRLTCLENTTIHQKDIYWKKNGVNETQTGNFYSVVLEESLGGGNYTCHSVDRSVLNHTMVLIKVDKKQRILVKDGNDDYVKCSTQNYSGGFQCSWTWDRIRVGKVAFIRVGRFSDTRCSVDTRDQKWTCSSGENAFNCWVEDSGKAISCQDKQHCPYAEESRPIHLTIFVRSQLFLLENYSKQFHLSEIVKPDKVRIRKVNTTLIEWSYPSSWSRPHSYFPLTFQIALFRRRCKDCVDFCSMSNASKVMVVNNYNSSQFQIKPWARSVCVRAKDAFCNSPWSEWSHIRMKRNKKNNKRNKYGRHTN
ncbi:interleukin 12Ba precursor [Gouania willdenowi]|uniref:Interleukin-12 subunit beta n=1 Tax=Gouania willdenowi TaxID=441366 RepID=A0A8C5D8H8_GOUWI|nr:interleukin-12 subunit beta [Gouania willdenowi]XP_028315794.1 interleukin-12 subunit beta [Gouania willdenowi]